MAAFIGSPTFMGIWLRIEAGMVQTHQSADAVRFVAAGAAVDIGGGDALSS